MPLNDYWKEWGVLYNAATLAFSKDIAKATKAGRDVGGSANTILTAPKNATAPLVQCLERIGKIDEASFTRLDDKNRKANVDLLAKEVKTLTGETKKYEGVLETALNSEVKLDHVTKAKVKDYLPDSYRQLKLLKTGISAIQARLANELKMQQVAKKSQKIFTKLEKDRDKAYEAGKEHKVQGLSDEANLKKLLLSVSKGFKSSMAKAAATIQKIKASPDVATYNGVMMSCARDINQNVGNIAKMKTNPGTKNLSKVKALPAPGALATDLTEFCNDTGALHRLPDTATKEEVEAAVKRFAALHKRIAATYAGLTA